MKMKSVAIALFCLIVCVFRTADGLSCYQCGVPNTPVCAINELGDLTLTACPADANNYCVLVNASINYFITVQRFCSSIEVGDCSSVPTPSGIIVSESCSALSCDRDGCNNAPSIAMNIVVLVVALFISRTLQME